MGNKVKRYSKEEKYDMALSEYKRTVKSIDEYIKANKDDMEAMELNKYRFIHYILDLSTNHSLNSVVVPKSEQLLLENDLNIGRGQYEKLVAVLEDDGYIFRVKQKDGTRNVGDLIYLPRIIDGKLYKLKKLHALREKYTYDVIEVSKVNAMELSKNVNLVCDNMYLNNTEKLYLFIILSKFGCEEYSISFNDLNTMTNICVTAIKKVHASLSQKGILEITSGVTEKGVNGTNTYRIIKL